MRHREVSRQSWIAVNRDLVKEEWYYIASSPDWRGALQSRMVYPSKREAARAARSPQRLVIGIFGDMDPPRLLPLEEADQPGEEALPGSEAQPKGEADHQVVQ